MRMGAMQNTKGALFILTPFTVKGKSTVEGQ